MKLLLSCISLILFIYLVQSAPCIGDCGEYINVRPSRVLGPYDIPYAERLQHEQFMRSTLDLAIAAKNKFTASIVAPNGTLMCTGVNSGKQNAILHGEIVAINNCSAMYGKSMWNGYTLYTTGESCPMCQSAIMWAGFAKVVYGSSIKDLYCKNCLGQIPIDSAYINARGYGMGSNVTIVGGILKSATDANFGSYCNSTSIFRVDPICDCHDH
eukprot:gene10662-13059_t